MHVKCCQINVNLWKRSQIANKANSCDSANPKVCEIHFLYIFTCNQGIIYMISISGLKANPLFFISCMCRCCKQKEHFVTKSIAYLSVVWKYENSQSLYRTDSQSIDIKHWFCSELNLKCTIKLINAGKICPPTLIYSWKWFTDSDLNLITNILNLTK